MNLIGTDMRSHSLVLSIGLHVAAVIVATVSLPWMKRDFEIPPPIMIEFVELGKVTQTTKVAPRPAPKQAEKEIPKETPPPPAAQNTSATPAPPAPKPPVKEVKKPEPKKETPVIDKNAPPDKKAPPKKDPPKTPEKKQPKAEPERDFSSVLKNLAEPKKTPAPPAKAEDLKLNEPAEAAQGHNVPLGAQITISEVDALRRQLEQCWNVPFGAKDAENLVIEIFMVINPDRTLREARIVDMARYNSDTFFRAAADSALRAVRSPLCSPFALPPDKYETWKNITVNFNPSEMF